MLKTRKGKHTFDGIKTMFLELRTDQVKLSYISEHIKRQWGEEYTIVTSEGTELEDSPVTQGLTIDIAR